LATSSGRRSSELAGWERPRARKAPSKDSRCQRCSHSVVSLGFEGGGASSSSDLCNEAGW
jgi:hypothetical protein